MSQANASPTQDDPYNIAPAEIEHALQLLWRESQGEDENATVVQVRTLNLLIVVPQELAQPDVFRAIDTLAVQHPGRTITMVVTPDATPPRANVTIACRFGDGGKQVCGEQITIISGDGGAPLPSIAASLHLPGVPTFLWWLGTPAFGSTLFQSFVESVDRVVVDSRTWDAPLVVLQQLAQAVRRQAYIAFTDLQWTALTPWRRQITQCFDLPQALPFLDRITSVSIGHGAAEGDRVAALLLVGWLATRLQWQAGKAGNGIDHLELRSQFGNLSVRLAAMEHASGLQQIMLLADTAMFKLSFLPATSCVKTEIMLPSHAPIERIARLTQLKLEQLVSQDLEMLARDTGYEATLLFVAQDMSEHVSATGPGKP